MQMLIKNMVEKMENRFHKSLSESFVLDRVTHKYRWGYSDTKFFITENNCIEVSGNRYPICGYEMPYFIPFLEEVLNVPFNFNKRKEKEKIIPKIKKNKAFIAAVEKKYGDQLVFDDNDRLQHSHGQTTADEIMKVIYNGTLSRIADAVFYCLSASDIEFLLKQAVKHNVCLVPYGGGTSVSCSLSLPEKERRMIVVVDMKKLSRILSIDKENNVITVEAGIIGEHLEQELNKSGYTLGHEPDSIEFSTVGGWIATNASGMKKNRYGNIEDIVNNYTLITPSGVLELSCEHSRMSAGMNLHKAFIGNEGNFGFVTKASLKIFKQAKIKKYQSIVFPSFEVGVAFLKDLQDEGDTSKPASIRLVDNLQFRFGRALRPEDTGISQTIQKNIQNFILSKIKKYDYYTMAAATIVFEGSREEVAGQQKLIKRLLKKHDGMFGGKQNGSRGYKLTFAIAYIRDFMLDHFVLGETYETTVPWNKIKNVCEAVEEGTKRLHKKYKFPGVCYLSPRISQLYQTGVCIYFTHGLSFQGVNNPEEKFVSMEKEIRKIIMDAGGSISHHHGVGKIRAGFMDRILHKDTMKILKETKKSIDPHNIMGIQNNIFVKNSEQQ